MEYIRGPKEHGCIFCRYITEDPSHWRERLVLCRRADAFVMLNKYPFASSHLMVVPVRHASELGSSPPRSTPTSSSSSARPRRRCASR